MLLDRWEGFTPTLGEVDGGRLTDEVHVMLREGASVGIHLVLAGDRSLVSGRIGTLTEDKLVLRLADRTDFSLAGINPRTVPDEHPARPRLPLRVRHRDAGRAARPRTPRRPGQAAALAAIAAEAQARDADVPRARRPFRVDVLPARLSFDAGVGPARRPADDRPLWALVGVGGDELRGARARARVRAPGVRRRRAAEVGPQHACC